MRAVRLTEEAKSDLKDIWRFIAQDNFDTADLVQIEIAEEITKLAVHPGMGHSREELRDLRHRVWRIYSYLIVYRFDDRELVVLRVLHGARDIGIILK